MAFTTPIIWVTAQMANATAGSATDLNAQIRDNFIVLGTHAHGTAGTGAGTQQVGGLIWMDEAVAAPAAPAGTLVILYAQASTRLSFIASDGVHRHISDSTHTHGGL